MFAPSRRFAGLIAPQPFTDGVAGTAKLAGGGLEAVGAGASNESLLRWALNTLSFINEGHDVPSLSQRGGNWTLLAADCLLIYPVLCNDAHDPQSKSMTPPCATAAKEGINFRSWTSSASPKNRCVRRPLHRGGWPGRIEGHRIFRAVQRRKFRKPAWPRSVHPPQGSGCGPRSSSAPVDRSRDARSHHYARLLLHVRMCSAAPEENLSMIADTVRYLRSRQVCHLRCGTLFRRIKLDPAYATATGGLRNRRGGPRRPVRHKRRLFAGRTRGHHPTAVAGCVRVGIHTHDDIGLGVANALAAVEAGNPGAGHDQRLRRTHRQLQSDQRHSEHCFQNEPALPAQRPLAQAQGSFPVRG